jgi:quercetin dioxygenase-like cupin family protein
VAIAFVASFRPQPPAARGTDGRATVVLQNAKVRIYRTKAGMLEGVAHGPGVVVSLESEASGKPGRAMWLDDVAVAPAGKAGDAAIVIVQPLEGDRQKRNPGPASKPGESPFTGMSFNPLFENERVSVLRARMEVDAREGAHTHASDTIVVHLSGGDIEDTANGKTVVNHWKPGDVEFEARGSSHSARNVSHAVDVILVALKP